MYYIEENVGEVQQLDYFVFQYIFNKDLLFGYIGRFCFFVFFVDFFVEQFFSFVEVIRFWGVAVVMQVDKIDNQCDN